MLQSRVKKISGLGGILCGWDDGDVNEEDFPANGRAGMRE
jgi:hypothetical protein